MKAQEIGDNGEIVLEVVADCFLLRLVLQGLENQPKVELFWNTPTKIFWKTNQKRFTGCSLRGFEETN